MPRSTGRLWLLWLILLSGGLPAFAFLLSRLGPRSRIAEAALYPLFPGYLLAVSISGNVHTVNPAIIALGSSVFWASIITVGVAAWRAITNRRRTT